MEYSFFCVFCVYSELNAELDKESEIFKYKQTDSSVYLQSVFTLQVIYLKKIEVLTSSQRRYNHKMYSILVLKNDKHVQR